jgi:hypothetical protein
MPRAAAPLWKQRKEPILDHLVQASVDQAQGVCDPDTGHYGTLVYAECKDLARAKEIVQALHRSAGHLKVSMSAKPNKQADGTYDVEFRAIDKAHARAFVIAKYGEDRSKWPYDPRKKNVKE